MKLTKRKGFNFFRSYYDVYNELSDKDKVLFMDALLDRQFLGVKPLNMSGMSKFAYISQTNSIDSQVKGYEDKTKTKLHPVDGVNNTPTEGGKTTPTEQVEEKVEEKEKNKKESKEPIFNFRKELIKVGLDENLANEYIKQRKKLKAPLTKLAFTFLNNQINLSKYNVNQIIKACLIKGWKSFKSDWDLTGLVEKEEVGNINNEKIIRYKSNVNPTIFSLPESKFLEMQERNKEGGYIYTILN